MDETNIEHYIYPPGNKHNPFQGTFADEWDMLVFGGFISRPFSQ